MVFLVFFSTVLNKEIYTQIIICTLNEEPPEDALQWLFCQSGMKTVPGQCCAMIIVVT